jgi:glyoxylase-like metal-dependent hydrolase (beta-lactamase superfamily II)
MRYRWQLLRAGPLLLDGGGMFGIIPKVVWNRTVPCDERNRITLSHNCLLLSRADADPGASEKILIESGSGDKLDEKFRQIFGLTDRTVESAVIEAGVKPDDVAHAIVSHLHFDHAGGLTRLARDSETPDWASPAGMRVKLTFPRAAIHAQRREWIDALANTSVMTRTYFKENLEPLRERLHLLDSPPPFPAGVVPRRDELPGSPVSARETEVLPGISVFLVPGHTWGQQAVKFTDDRGRTVVFTPDVMPTVNHVGAAYNLAYDVEPYTSMLTRRWFLSEAAANDWLLVLDHEPGNPLVRVRADGKGWFTLVPQE